MNAESKVVAERLELPSAEPQVVWSGPARVAFRFACLYFPLFVGVGAFHQRGPSSDTAAMYRSLAVILAVSSGGTMLWSILDRRRPSYPRVHRALELFLCAELFSSMCGYGGSKLFAAQFPTPDGITLSTPIGQLTPIALLWAFMGYSTVYQVFAGAVEFLSAVLLFFRGTRTLGALVVCAAMTNVLMLNIGYDVCVKVLSAHLLLMGMVLVVPDLRRLLDFFVLNRPISPKPEIQRSPVRRRMVIGVKWALAALVISALARHGVSVWHRTHVDAATSLPVGLYEVVASAQDSKSGAAAASERWKRLVLENSWLGIQHEDGTTADFRVVASRREAIGGVLTVAPRPRGARAMAELRWHMKGRDTLVLEGDWEGHPLSLQAHLVPDSSFPLETHGTHWVKEGFD